jgi:hypothetical protein
MKLSFIIHNTLGSNVKAYPSHKELPFALELKQLSKSIVILQSNSTIIMYNLQPSLPIDHLLMVHLQEYVRSIRLLMRLLSCQTLKLPFDN